MAEGDKDHPQPSRPLLPQATLARGTEVEQICSKSDDELATDGDEVAIEKSVRQLWSHCLPRHWPQILGCMALKRHSKGHARGTTYRRPRRTTGSPHGLSSDTRRQLPLNAKAW